MENKQYYKRKFTALQLNTAGQNLTKLCTTVDSREFARIHKRKIFSLHKLFSLKSTAEQYEIPLILIFKQLQIYFLLK